MPTPPSYRIVTENRIVKVYLEGVWDLPTDIAYLNELSEAMRKSHNTPWALIVDMRGWIVTEEIENFKSKINLQMDRRNQELECWIVDDMHQGSHVVHFIKRSGMPFKRFMDEDSAKAWLAEFGYDL